MSERQVAAMVLAAGLGTRLGSLTQQKSKALVEINGKPLLLIVIEKLAKFGFNDIIVNVHHFGEQVIKMLSQLHLNNINIIVSDERQLLLDTGGGILKSMPYFNHKAAVLVHNVDIISDFDLRQFVDEFLVSGDDAWLATQNRESSRKLLFDDQNILTGWTNQNTNAYKWVDAKKHYRQALSFSGIHCFNPAIFSNLEVKKCSIIDLYLEAAKNHRIVSKQLPHSYWFDLGKPDQLESAAIFLKDLKKP